MLKIIKPMIFVTFLFLMVSVLSACGEEATSGNNNDTSSDNEYSFKLGHETPTTHIFHKTAEKFAEELESRSDGRMKLEIFPSRQLGEEKDMVQQLETGALDFGFITNAYMTTRQESLNAWFMPFMFENLAEADKATESEAAQQMLADLDNQGLKAFDFFFAGNRHLLMIDSPVNSPGDLNGKKLRTLTAQSAIDFWSEVGVGPTPMPLSEIYTSLQTGMIDGIDIDLDAIVAVKFYEVADNLTISNHMTFPNIPMMSKKVYEELSADDQKIVDEAMAAAVEWGVQEAIKREESNLKALKDEGVNVNKIENSDAFSEATEKVKAKWSEKSPLIKNFIEQN